MLADNGFPPDMVAVTVPETTMGPPHAVEPSVGPATLNLPPENDHPVTVAPVTVQVTVFVRVTVEGEHDIAAAGSISGTSIGGEDELPASTVIQPTE
jgi:hypothetical protein